MIVFEGLEENFKFMTMEVSNIVDATEQFLDNPTRELLSKITSRDDYVDNLKNVIENKCFSKIHTGGELSERGVNTIRAMQTMCVNLERIADFCVNVVRQVEHFSEPSFMSHYDYPEMFRLIRESLENVQQTRTSGDLAGALAVCKSEYDLDRLYKDVFDRLMAELSRGREVQNLITALFIFRYLERVGDSLLNIGEALIFSIIGERIKIEQFDALQQTLSKTGFTGSVSDIDFQSIWGSRSGCRIGRVRNHGDQSPEAYAHGSLFKEGNLKKILREKQNIERWEKVFPGLGPRIFSYHEEGDKASLLVEFLPGCTLDEVIISGDKELFLNAFFVLTQTLRQIWTDTLSHRPCKADFVEQIRARRESVLQVHPDFDRQAKNVGLAQVMSSSELLNRCQEIEKDLSSPLSILIHGDFNTNNVVYDHDAERVHFIDFYRSDEGDYVQDVSVFLMSNFRIPLFGHAERERLNWTIRHFYDFALGFAAEHGDETFQARLALGLARSFYTSTRFELNQKFAKEMFLRSHFMLEKVLAHEGRPWSQFVLPHNVLLY